MLRTRAPLRLVLLLTLVRLACIRPAASVHPEPGSNSPLYTHPGSTLQGLLLLETLPGASRLAGRLGLVGVVAGTEVPASNTFVC